MFIYNINCGPLLNLNSQQVSVKTVSYLTRKNIWVPKRLSHCFTCWKRLSRTFFHFGLSFNYQGPWKTWNEKECVSQVETGSKYEFCVNLQVIIYWTLWTKRRISSKILKMGCGNWFKKRIIDESKQNDKTFKTTKH